ncbi:YfkD family protein [Bacillus sp. REN10]|uniref:YfkD family protein n=1 Tax=Bacillus sp. REN10 TaxID=2782541 RepID=UPI00193B8426|nr:YfkD family protein [Bacillus sp. REN10]
MKLIRLLLSIAIVLAFSGIDSATAKQPFQIPSSVKDITKENTFLNEEQEMSELQPTELTKELLSTSKAKITNPKFIRMLNETDMNKSPFAFGVRATVYLGEWPLSYHSEETTPNWQYQKINTNFYDNRHGKNNYQMHYVQETYKSIKGGLSAKVPRADEVQEMVLKEVIQKTKLPLAYSTVVGNGTKQNDIYNVAPKTAGYLHSFAPAVHEKGIATFGEVYLVISGWNRAIVVKNITSKRVTAWIPIKNHLSFSYQSVR